MFEKAKDETEGAAQPPEQRDRTAYEHSWYRRLKALADMRAAEADGDMRAAEADGGEGERSESRAPRP